MSNKTQVSTREINLLIVGIRRAMKMYTGQLEIETKDGYLHLGDPETGEMCQIKLSDNVRVRGE